MHLLAGIGNFGESLGGYLIPFLFVLTIVVFFHELGHFLVARLCGVKVETFSIGFGREIVGWNDRHGTRWKVSWIPLGGYVKFVGDESAASTPDRRRLAEIPPEERGGLFHFKPLHQRAAVVAAGPFANFVLAILLFAGLFTFAGQTVATPVVDGVQPEDAGIVVLGASSDHLMLDVQDAVTPVRLGDEIGFTPSYGSLLAATTSPSVQKVIVRG